MKRPSRGHVLNFSFSPMFHYFFQTNSSGKDPQKNKEQIRAIKAQRRENKAQHHMVCVEVPSQNQSDTKGS